MAASISRRLFGVSTTVAGITLMAAAVATISTGFPLVGREELDNGAAAIALLKMGLTAVVAGSAILALLYFFRHWPSAQLATSDKGDRAEMGPALMLFGAYLATLPFWFVAAAAPAIRRRSRSRRRPPRAARRWPTTGAPCGSRCCWAACRSAAR